VRVEEDETNSAARDNGERRVTDCFLWEVGGMGRIDDKKVKKRKLEKGREQRGNARGKGLYINCEESLGKTDDEHEAVPHGLSSGK